jgi:hypothetical protein
MLWQIIMMIATAVLAYVFDEHVVMPAIFQNVFFPFNYVLAIVLVAVELAILYGEFVLLIHSD